jgi:tape measure domain-containing protein
MANEEIVVQLRAEIQGFKTQLQQATDAISKFTQTASDTLKQPINPMNQLLGSVKNLIVGYIGLQAATQAVGRSFNQALRLDAVKSSLTAVLGSTELADAKLKEISQTADYLGLNFLDLATSYKSFAASALSSNQTLGDTDKIFNSVTKAAAVLKLSSEDVKGTLNALGQMFSKGQVSAEELRQQLGERLPGAVALMAAGLGVSTKALNKMLEQGQVTTAAVIKLAGQLDIAYGDKIVGKVDSLQASVERLNNTFTQVVENGNLGKLYKYLLDFTNDRVIKGFEMIAGGIRSMINGFESLNSLELTDKLDPYYKSLKKIQSTPIAVDQKDLILQQGQLNAVMDENIHLFYLAEDVYGKNSTIAYTLNKQYNSLAATLKKVSALIKPGDGEIISPNNLNTIKGLSDEIKKVKTELDLIPKGEQLISKQAGLDKLVEQLKQLKFYAEGVDPNSLISISAQIAALNDEASKLPISSKRLEEINAQLVKLGAKKTALEDALKAPPAGELQRYQQEIERIQQLQATTWDTEQITAYANMIKRLQDNLQGLTAVTYTNAQAFTSIWQSTFATFVSGTQYAFEQALFTGQNFTQNFKEIFLAMMKSMIAKLVSALVIAVLLAGVLSAFGGGIAAGAKMFGMKGVTNFGTLFGSVLGVNTEGRVAMPSNSTGEGNYQIDIMGDKMRLLLDNTAIKNTRVI